LTRKIIKRALDNVHVANVHPLLRKRDNFQPAAHISDGIFKKPRDQSVSAPSNIGTRAIITDAHALCIGIMHYGSITHHRFSFSAFRSRRRTSLSTASRMKIARLFGPDKRVYALG
jgi:hypothetical protein